MQGDSLQRLPEISGARADHARRPTLAGCGRHRFGAASFEAAGRCCRGRWLWKGGRISYPTNVAAAEEEVTSNPVLDTVDAWSNGQPFRVTHLPVRSAVRR